ncbi:unnamed protein product [Symbiodinium natans]|uniref:Uncharacterized protein n=1 Tax=Symbiodinium natans TaxID=878477 RepID=A0A812RH73_9DINO|nr:unnamed protein product [Symbiodinium natans]
MHCQDKLPACAHTFMFRSYASNEVAVQNARSAGISASLSTRFDFSLEKAGRGHTLAFSVMGSENEELLLGQVEVVNGRVLGETWLCVVGCLATGELCRTAAGSMLQARACAASLLERAAFSSEICTESYFPYERFALSLLCKATERALTANRAARLRIEELETSMDAGGRLGLGLQRSAAAAQSIEETLAELRALRRREELAVQWMSFMEQYGGNGLYQGHHRICT